MSHIFISYNHTDKRFAYELKRQVEDYGFSVWIDQRIPIGALSQDEIAEKLKESIAVFLVITPNALKSEYVDYEWHFALNTNIPLIPIYLKEVDKLPYPLRNVQYIDFRVKRHWGKLFERLKKLESTNTNNSKKEAVEKVNPIVERLLRGLKHKNVSTRIGSAKTLSQFEDDAAIDGLLDALNDPNNQVREQAAYSLAKRERDDIPFSLLVNLHGDKNAEVRSAAATSLGTLATPEAISGLIEAIFNNDDYGVREACINSLEMLDWSIADTDHDDEYIASLTELLSNCGEYVEEQSSLKDKQSHLNDDGLESAMASGTMRLRLMVITREIELCEKIASILEEIGTPEALAAAEEWRRKQQNQQ